MKPGTVVLVPFPFTDIPVRKRRPAVVVSVPIYNQKTDHIVCVMVTSAEHSSFLYDTRLVDPEMAGLPKACMVRFKLFTLHQSLVVRELGRLGAGDWKQVKENLMKVMKD